MKTFKSTILKLLLFISFMLFSGVIMAIDTPEDKDITNAVDNELFLNATTPSYLIDVVTEDGIVTLNGSVDNILAKDRAVKIARTVRGVRAVVDKIDVDAPYRSDDILESDVNNALLSDPATDSYEINVNAINGLIMLTGTVESWQEKQLSEYIAKGVIGVKSVTNNITVNYKTDRSDFEIEKEIEQSLNNDIRIDDALIKVSVENGKVELSGTVGSASEKSLAQTKAWTAGVRLVNGEGLNVKEWARDENLRKNKYVFKTDIEIRDAVKDAFLYDPRVLSFNPDISVSYGVVTLTGAVDNLKAKRAAEQDAKNVVGVFRVKNYLKVRPTFIPEDKDLETDIKTALMKDPVVEKWEVDVTANNGVVYLNGRVDSYYEKSKAEDLASRIKGVISVQNNLSVYDDNDYYFYNYYGWNTFYPPYHVDVVDNYKSDDAIKEDIIDELWWSPFVNEDEVNVSVKNREAILTGTVDTKREKLYAEINALEGGAKNVENNITVNYTP